ncbi:MAG: hypothetical protein CENE_00951 [Candidatus Celerinatantimonas neptuna]|nr:MAG: hypothetical protein CENE_00951 [Candidatus Celerinatantimonas neptuna]
MLDSEKKRAIHHISDHDILTHLPSRFSERSTIYGGIIRRQDGICIPLRNYHTFGRSPNCHSILTSPDISRLHMLICWCKEQQSWYIQDRSTNGIWINRQKLIKYHAQELSQNDRITLSSKNGHCFTLIATQPPCDVMVNLDAEKPSIYLNKPITIISDSTYFLYAHYGWLYVTRAYNECQQSYQTIQDSEVIHIYNNKYRLQINREEFNTIKNRPTPHSIADLIFEFTVSEDEENISLQITAKNQSATIDGLRLQSQLYLLLYMARKSLEDQSQGYAKCNRGWLNLNMLSKKLGITPENIRIRIHRLRNRLREIVNFNSTDVCQLIQLQDGDIRLNASQIKILRKDQPSPKPG